MSNQYRTIHPGVSVEKTQLSVRSHYIACVAIQSLGGVSSKREVYLADDTLEWRPEPDVQILVRSEHPRSLLRRSALQVSAHNASKCSHWTIRRQTRIAATPEARVG